jgi:hypothetical protein
MNESLRIAVVSHAYNNVETIKSLKALAEHADVFLLAPARHRALVFEEAGLPPVEHAQLHVRALRYRKLWGGQYLLRGLKEALKQAAPSIIIVEYDPWSILFHQVAHVADAVAPAARIVVAVKKNTYRRLQLIPRVGKRLLAEAGLRRTAHVIAASQRSKDLYLREFFQ